MENRVVMQGHSMESLYLERRQLKEEFTREERLSQLTLVPSTQI
jgi:hypothetical protein